jgi:hypothetical protein
MIHNARFTSSRGLGIGVSWVAMHLFLLLPNIMTQRFRRFGGLIQLDLITRERGK